MSWGEMCALRRRNGGQTPVLLRARTVGALPPLLPRPCLHRRRTFRRVQQDVVGLTGVAIMAYKSNGTSFKLVPYLFISHKKTTSRNKKRILLLYLHESTI